MAGSRTDLDVGRVLRVTLPVRQHIQLHKLRLLVGKNMSDVVEEALDLYFRAFNEAQAREEGEPEPEPADPR